MRKILLIVQATVPIATFYIMISLSKHDADIYKNNIDIVICLFVIMSISLMFAVLLLNNDWWKKKKELDEAVDAASRQEKYAIKFIQAVKNIAVSKMGLTQTEIEKKIEDQEKK